MKILHVLFLCFVFFWGFSAHAVSIIRDTEIEETVTGWAKKIFKAVNLPPENAEIVLVNDPSINAFVVGGQTIFVHTGLLTQATSIDDVMFVLSHETGHIVGGHITRGITAMEKAKTTTLISTILGGILAVAAGRPDAGIAIMIGSQGSALGQFLTYRQTEESSADRIAVDVMKKLGYSMQGFVNIMQHLRRLERLNDESDLGYLRTHPMTQSRVHDLGRFTENAPPVKKDPMFERIKAKLIGFMQKPQDVLNHYKGNTFSDRYAQAIAFYQMHDLNKSFQLLDTLIKEKPNDPYLYEMKGQFSFEKGFIDEAIKNYEQANKIKPHQPLIELALAQAYLEKDDTNLAQKALPILSRATVEEPDLALGWRLMATAYNKLGKDLESDYAMAEYERASNKLPAAQKRAKKLIEHFNKQSPYYQKLQDIIALKEEE
ncbi:MAG: M48 family metallopeptidase [Alphaproteobacteria bacterium]|nr:M48 family metallopeptidase [Alphaproteobacteria bacterium]